MANKTTRWAVIGVLAFIASVVATVWWRLRPAHASEITGLEFYSNSLVSAGLGDGLKVWDVKSKGLLFKSRWSYINKFRLLGASGRIVIGGSDSGEGLHLGAIQGAPKLTQGGDRWRFTSVLAVHEGANQIAVGYPSSSPELASILEVSSGDLRYVGRTAGEGQSNVTAISFTGDGKSVVIGLDNGGLLVIDSQSLKRREITSFRFRISAIQSVPLKSQQVLVALQPRSGHFVQDSVTGDIRGSGENTLWRVDLQEGQVAPFGTFSGPVDAIALSPKGRYISWSSVGGSVMVYDFSSSQQRAVLSPGEPAQVTCLAFSPDEGALASGDGRGCIMLWSLPMLIGTELR